MLVVLIVLILLDRISEFGLSMNWLWSSQRGVAFNLHKDVPCTSVETSRFLFLPRMFIQLSRIHIVFSFILTIALGRVISNASLLGLYECLWAFHKLSSKVFSPKENLNILVSNPLSKVV